MPLATRFPQNRSRFGKKKVMPKRTYSSANPLKALEPPPEPETVVQAKATLPQQAPQKKKDHLVTQSEHVPSARASRFHKTKKLVKTRSLKFSARDFVTTKVGQDLKDVYQVHDMVGEGGFGEVYRCTHRKTGSQRAVKVLPRSRAKCSQENDEVRNEFQAIKMLDHPNILKQYHMYEGEDKFHIVSDLYQGGEMLDYLTEHGRMEEHDVVALMNHLLSCINYIHQQGWCHRDLKPENILLCDNQKWEDIKVIDFGLAKKHDAQKEGPMTEVYGTPYYMAPQVLQGSYTNKCDIWSIGSICFTALSGYACFDGDDMNEVVQWVLDGDWDFDDDLWNEVSDEAKDFITQLLTFDEDKRPSALEALQHPWLVAERRASKKAVFTDESLRSSMHDALQGMQNFDVGQSCKLKQATYALLSSQLLPKEERIQIDEMFRILDVDCNGRLTKEEVKKGFKDFYDKHMTQQEVDDLFLKVNFSGSGEIEYSEFVCACVMVSDIWDEKRLRAAFDAFDVDGSGTISVDNLRQVFGECSVAGAEPVDDETLDMIIQQIDDNGDGEIDFEEFKVMMSIRATQPSKDTIRAWHDSKLMFSNFNLGFSPADLEDDDDELPSCTFHNESVHDDTDGILVFEDEDDAASPDKTTLRKERTVSLQSHHTASTSNLSFAGGDESASSLASMSEHVPVAAPLPKKQAPLSSASSHQRELDARKDELKTVSVHNRRAMFESRAR